jgi:hypothetical protein
MYTPNEMGKKALAGVPFVPIVETEKGLKVYRKTLKDEEVLPHVHKLLVDALRRVYDLQKQEGVKVVGTNLPTTVEDALLAIKQESALFTTSSTNDFHRVSRIIERLTEALAILKYIAGDEIFLTEYVKKISA